VLAGWSVFSFLPYLGNRSKSDTCSYELFCLESHILSFPKVLQIPPESPCIYTEKNRREEKKVTQLFLETNALYEIHKFIQYQQGNISKAVFITLSYFTAKDKHYSCPFEPFLGNWAKDVAKQKLLFSKFPPVLFCSRLSSHNWMP